MYMKNLKMLNPLNFISKIFKSSNQIEIDKIQYLLKKINDFEDEISKLEDKDFPKRTLKLKSKLVNGSINDEIICEAFAQKRSQREKEEKDIDVQILGGLILHQGKIAEMKTGEGKTITPPAAYLNSLMKGVHIVTVNDYLAKRDCENMSKIYNYLGVLWIYK